MTNGTSTVFKVAEKGVVTLTGVHGSDALTLTNGNIKLTSGDITLSTTDSKLTFSNNGSIVIPESSSSAFSIDDASGNAKISLLIQVVVV